jgi:pimeloyl-ACP methyl ester carboxylesterase
MAEKLFFEIIGKSMPLVCLHAFPLDHTEWLDVAELLKTNFTLILPDIRGHGRSLSPEGLYSMKELAEDVIALLDHLEIDKAGFAGHSMGGYVALSITKNFPDRVTGLALVASHAYADSPEKKVSRLEDIETVKEQGPLQVLSGMPSNLSEDPKVQEFCKHKISLMGRNGVIGVLAAMADREDSIEFLKKFNEPLGIIAGTQDRFIPLEMSRKMAEDLHPEVYVEIENSGHMPMLENPVDVAEALANLFQS